MPAEALNAPEREEIRVGICRSETDRQIAARLGRPRTTVNAEISRTGGRASYTASGGQARADAQRARPKTAKLVADPVLAAHMTARLEAKESPMTISVELARGTHALTAAVPHECIYQGV